MSAPRAHSELARHAARSWAVSPKGGTGRSGQGSAGASSKVASAANRGQTQGLASGSPAAARTASR